MNEHVKVLTKFDPEMFDDVVGPHVSIYFNTHQITTENGQDQIRLKTLINEAEEVLAKKYEKRQYLDIIEGLRGLIDNPDTSFWKFMGESIAILAHADDIFIYHLDYPVHDTVIAAESYHIKPLIKNFQYGQHYYVLALSADRFSLYRGDFHAVEKIVLPEEIKTEFSELFDDFDNTSSVNVGSYGGKDPQYHGHQSKDEVTEKETEKYFRYVNKVLYENYSQEEACPIILVSLVRHQALFRSLATLPNLIPEGIEKPYDSMGEDEIIVKASKIIVAEQTARIEQMLNEYGFAQSQEIASSDPSTIANALAERKVARLFVEQDRLLPGQFDVTKGTVSFVDQGDLDVDDIVDDFAQAVYLQGGEVYVLDKESMPTDTGVAALFRY